MHITLLNVQPVCRAPRSSWKRPTHDTHDSLHNAHSGVNLRQPMRLLIVVSLASAVVAAQAPVPRYEVKRAAAPPTIDGKLDDAAWATAPRNHSRPSFP